MPTYLNVNNQSKLLKTAYANVDGVSKKCTKIYANVDGYSKLVYSSSGGGGTIDWDKYATFDPGLYDLQDNLVCSWANANLDVSISYGESSSYSNYYKTTATSGYSTFVRNPNAKIVVLPSNTDIINNYAFAECDNLVYVYIPPSCTLVGNGVFYECGRMKVLRIYGNFASGSKRQCYGCVGLTEVTIKTATFIPQESFVECTKLKTLKIDSAITEIQSNAFTNCTALSKVTLPTSIRTISNQAFYSSGVSEINLPNGLTTIGQSAFLGTLLTDVTIPASVSYMGGMVFMRCQRLQTLDLSNYGGSIGNALCVECGQLETVTISSNTTYIDSYAFYNCTNLSLTIPDNITTIGASAFGNVPHIYYSSNMTATGSPWGAKAVN